MIQFNLLPDVKLEFVKANRLKHAVSVISIIAAAVALGIMAILILTVDVIQKSHLNDLNSQIVTITGQLRGTSNLNQVLTVQSQVNALPALNANKPVTTRLLGPTGYMAALTPANATISQINIDFNTNVISITGSADSLATVNQFVDTMKLSSYQTSSSQTSKNAFSNVVLSTFAFTSTSGATYTISATFDPALFSSASNTVTLNVPSSNSSRSSSIQTLFQANPTTTSGSTTSSGSSSTNSGTNGN